MITITRKIQLIINQDNVTEIYKKLYDWQEITFRAYNYTATHLYIQENIKEFFYMNDDFKLNLHKKTEEKPDGIFTTSKQNTTYQLLSSKFKGDIPADVLTNINQRVALAFNAERKNYFAGKQSLRTYKRNVPIPFSKTSMINFQPVADDKGNINYTFNLFNINFKTFFGRDLSNNQEVFERGLAGEYQFAGSTLLLDRKKIFLLLSFSFEADENNLDSNKTAVAEMSFNAPVVVKIGKKIIDIGTKEGYLHHRLAIRGARSRLQKNLRFTNGGHGRAEKLKALEQFEKKEKDYVDTVLHKYSKRLIELCVNNKVGNLVLSSQSEERKAIDARLKEIENDKTMTRIEKKQAEERAKFVIANWSYYGFTEKIQYKAKIAGINVTIEK